MNKVALVVGGTGLTGTHLLNYLVKSREYSSVVSLVRKKTGNKHAKLTEHVIDFENIDAFSDLIKGDDFFCCLGTTMSKAGSKKEFEKVDLHYPTRIATAASSNGVNQIYLMSSMGANPQSKNFYNRTKGYCEGKIKLMPFNKINIFRPSLLVGKRDEFRFAEKLGAGLMTFFNLFLVGKMAKYKSIKAKSVARAMYKHAQMNDTDSVCIIKSDQIKKLSKSK